MCQPVKNVDDIVWQFPHSVAVLGTWQFYHGYCLLISRQHAAELFALDPLVRSGYLEEMTLLAKAIHEVFKPHKINYELLGNQVPHLHWHLFPRYLEDSDHLSPVWLALHRAERDTDLRMRMMSGSGARIVAGSTERSTTINLLRRQLTQWGAATA
jgi:diadenosine tetraphosphate (Ap4A) HIT family hydrolase